MVLRTIPQESRAGDHIMKAREFFFSPQFASVPVVKINAILRAAMGLKAKNSGRKPEPGDQYDLAILSAYMPYCDAMLVDGEMRSLATEGKASLDQDYGTQLFSGKKLTELCQWFDEVEASFPIVQKEAVSDVYEEQFHKLKPQKGRNLLDRRKDMITLRPTSMSAKGKGRASGSKPID